MYLITRVKGGLALPPLLSPSFWDMIQGDGVPEADKLKYDGYFESLDKSGKGLLSGTDVAGFFQKSGLDARSLAEIWNTVDKKRNGLLDKEAFGVAMHLIKVKMGESNAVGTPALPSQRNSTVADLLDLSSLSFAAPSTPGKAFKIFFKF